MINLTNSMSCKTKNVADVSSNESDAANLYLKYIKLHFLQNPAVLTWLKNLNPCKLTFIEEKNIYFSLS